jgi:hypothetical protein
MFIITAYRKIHKCNYFCNNICNFIGITYGIIGSEDLKSVLMFL